VMLNSEAEKFQSKFKKNHILTQPPLQFFSFSQVNAHGFFIFEISLFLFIFPVSMPTSRLENREVH